MSDDDDLRHVWLTGLGLFRRIWRYCRLRKLALGAMLAACALETAFYWIVPLSFRSLIDNALGARDPRQFETVLLVLVGGALTASVASIRRGRLHAHLQSQIASDMRFELFHKIQTLPTAFFNEARTGQVLSRFAHDLSAVDSTLSMAITWGLLPALDSSVGTLVLFVLDWRLALVAALAWPWCALVPPRIAPRAASASYRRKQDEARVLEAVEQAIAGHGVVKAYNLEEYVTRDFLDRDAGLFATSARMGFYRTLMEQSATSGLLTLQVVTLALGAWFAFRGWMTVGTLAAFQALHLSVGNSLLYVMEFVRGLLPARAGMQRIDEFLAEPGGVADRADAVPVPPLAHAIEFRDVCFAYGDRLALDRLSLRVTRGAFVAIVGRSGSGKSTVLNLLLRMRDPSSGSILIDGVDLRSGRQRSWRAHLGVVFQENFLFDTTVRENIRLGWPQAGDADVEAAAMDAEIHAFIEQLPQGYDTPVGERGGRLSGGQRQRLALARALVRNPSVLILDEATSALDAETEAAITRTLRRLARDRTVIMVTHRLTAVVGADHVFVLDGGRLVEHGTHTQLVHASGAYAQMWRTQSAGAAPDASVSPV